MRRASSVLLRQTPLFEHVYRAGHWVRGTHLSIGQASNGLPILRVGLRTRKGLKGAVIRNRLKRQMRAILAGKVQRWPIGVDVVIVIHPKHSSLTSSELSVEFSHLCSRL